MMSQLDDSDFYLNRFLIINRFQFNKEIVNVNNIFS